ncbi:hypothetical protein [Nocardioides sp.]|uniref:hypothetical protein n=1 Tax=Nocardioides sp. TaxID=35761 RepID=UPI003513E098
MSPLTAHTLWHLGALHPAEQALAAALAFGPFLVLGVVVTLRQRALRAEDDAARGAAASQEASVDSR